MFTPIGRRLALLNAAVVVAVIAVVGAAIFLLLRQSLDSEADQALAERADSALETWANRFPRGRPGASATPAAAHPAPPTARPAEDQAVLESGDVLLFAVAPDGAILAASTEKPIPGLPDRVARDRPDLIISDLALPGESGIQLVRWVRGLSKVLGRDTPCIAITAFPQTYPPTSAHGFTAYMRKPLDVPRLCSIAAALLEPAPK